MKKAFEQNVSRARPRLRLGAMASDPTGAEELESAAPSPQASFTAPPVETTQTHPSPVPAHEAELLAAELRARVERAQAPQQPVAEAVQYAQPPVYAPVAAVAPVMAQPQPQPQAQQMQSQVQAWAGVPQEHVVMAVAANGRGVSRRADEPHPGKAQVQQAQKRGGAVGGGGASSNGAVQSGNGRGKQQQGKGAQAASAPKNHAQGVDVPQPYVQGAVVAQKTATQVAQPQPPSAYAAQPVYAQQPAMTNGHAANGHHPSADAALAQLASLQQAQAHAAQAVAYAEAMQAQAQAAAQSYANGQQQAYAGYGPGVMPMEVQTPPSELPIEELEPEVRRERLKERLKAVRENPRPEPLPPTVAEAGELAVGRISTLQTDLAELKALNLALSQDLEGARRQAEKATEEARLRMDESRRLTEEMDGRIKLLSELERELGSLEGERDEALLALQETRRSVQLSEQERATLHKEIEKRDRALADSLSEEERMADELESAHDEMVALRRTVEALSQERDTLARQVSELTTERAELLEARKALESVHRALTHAQRRS